MKAKKRLFKTTINLNLDARRHTPCEKLRPETILDELSNLINENCPKVTTNTASLLTGTTSQRCVVKPVTVRTSSSPSSSG